MRNLPSRGTNTNAKGRQSRDQKMYNGIDSV